MSAAVEFSSEELSELTESELVQFFSQVYWNEKNHKNYFECLLIPSQCKFMTGTTDEALGRRRIASHLTKHVAKLGGSRSSVVKFYAAAEEREKALKVKARIRREASPIPNEVMDYSISSLDFFGSHFDTVVTKLSESEFAVTVEGVEKCFSIHLDVDKKSISVDGIDCPVVFKVDPVNYFIYDVDWERTEERPPDDERDSLDCPESLSNIIAALDCREMQEFLTGNSFPKIRDEHNYCDFWIRTPKPYLYTETMKAVSIYNCWKASESAINFGVNRLLDSNQQDSIDYSESFLNLMKKAGVYITNQLWFPYDSTLSRSIVIQKEETVHEDPSGPSRSAITPVQIMPELLSHMTSRKYSLINSSKIVPMQYSPPKDPALSSPSIVHTALRTPEDDRKEEGRKREIALAALAELKTEFRRHRARSFFLSENGTLESKQTATKSVSSRSTTGTTSSRTCKICNQRFTARGSLRAHYRSHAGVKPFSCHICGSAFTRRHSLNYHLLCHSGDTKYKCTLCPKTFRHSGHYKDHIRMHQCQPFLCPVCGFKFSNRTTLRRHLKLSHNRETATEVAADEETADAVRTLSKLRAEHLKSSTAETASGPRQEERQPATSNSTSLDVNHHENNQSIYVAEPYMDDVGQNLTVGETLTAAPDDVLNEPTSNQDSNLSSVSSLVTIPPRIETVNLLSASPGPSSLNQTVRTQVRCLESAGGTISRSANILRRVQKRSAVRSTGGQCHIHPLKGDKILPPRIQTANQDIQISNASNLIQSVGKLPPSDPEMTLPQELLEYFEANSSNEPLNTPKTNLLPTEDQSQQNVSVLQFTSHDLGHIDLTKCNLVLVSEDEAEEQS